MKKSSAPPPAATFDTVALDVLAYELDPSQAAESERKIKSRLKRKKLAPYDDARVAELRRLKDELRAEIGLAEKSRFFLGQQGHFVDPADFDLKLLAKETISRFPDLPRPVVESFVRFGVFIYYLL